MVFNSFVNHFLPVANQITFKKESSSFDSKQANEDYMLAIDEKTQEEIYDLAHKSLQMVMDCNQL